MRNEITAAVIFLARLIEKGEKFNQEQMEHFKLHLSRLLVERCKDHWFPDKPDKGQGYRCIRVNGVFHDPILKMAASASGIKYEDINLPYELTVWVDPNEVCCRFGETTGTFCTLASFNTKVEMCETDMVVNSPPRISFQLSLPEFTPDPIRKQFEMVYQLLTKSRNSPGRNKQ